MSILDIVRHVVTSLTVLGPSEPKPDAEIEVSKGEIEEPGAAFGAGLVDETPDAEDADAPEGTGEPASGEPEGSAGEGEEPAGTSTEAESPGTSTPAAPEADEGADMAVEAIRASVDAKLANAQVATPKLAFKFSPTITDEQIAAYEKAVDDGKVREGLSNLMGAAIAEAFEAYHTNIVEPVKSVADEVKRERANAARWNEWASKNPKSAKDPELVSAMSQVYGEYATKYGAVKADLMTFDEMRALAKSRAKATTPAKPAPKPAAKPASEQDALRSATMPKTVGRIRGVGQPDSRQRAAAESNDFIRFLKGRRTDPF